MTNQLADFFSLANQTAVVIGGTGELCGAMATGLAQAGAHVVLVGRSAEKGAQRIEQIEQAGGTASFESCDATDRAELDQLLARIIQRYQSVEILINGAGINSARPFFEIDETEFDQIISTNLKSVFLACQVFGQQMTQQSHGGSIINLGSMSGLTPLSRVFTYSASKAAVHNLSRNLAREWAPYQVRVNTLVPGFFPAEQNRKVLTPERTEQIMKHTPMARFGSPSELIGATLLLAGPAGSFITGAELIVDGGFSAMTI